MATRRRAPADWTEPWREWKGTIHDSMQAHLGFRPGLAVLEQHMIRSAAEQRCVECGEPGTVEQERTEHSPIQSVARYWFCGDCDAYWRAKAPSRRRARGKKAARAVSQGP